jgi:zona occludens toxin
MISLVTGTPGAGKTYLAVNLIIDRYYEKIGGMWELKKAYKDYTVFTNIDGLKLPHKSLDEIFEKTSFESFFDNDYQKSFREKYPKCIYILDECQRYLPYNYKNSKVIYYFDYHRHYSDEIILITQDIRKITPSVSTLVEFEYRAIKPTFQIPGFFTYFLKSGGEIFARKTVRKKKDIFELYNSFQAPDGAHNVGKAKIIYIVLFLILCIIMLLIYFIFVRHPFQKKEKENYNQENKIEKNSNPPLNQHKKEEIKYSKLPEPDKIKIVLIKDYYSYQNQIVTFRCPKTNEIINIIQADYKIFNLQNKFYASIPESQLFRASGEPHTEESKRARKTLPMFAYREQDP